MHLVPTASRSSLSRYFQEIRERGPLSREEEFRLATRKGDGRREALDALVEANLVFVAKVAIEYRNMGLPLEDLLSEGNIGLLEAARRFDASKGCKFITYASWWVRKAIRGALSEHARVVKLPSYQKARVRRVREAERVLEQELGRRPRLEEITRRSGMTAGKTERLLRLVPWEISLDEKIGREKDAVLADCLEDRSLSSAEDDLIQRESSTLVRKAMRALSPQERMVITHRFGLEGQPSQKLREIAATLGLSRERVRQIENQAKLRMRRFLLSLARSAPFRKTG